MSGVVIALLLMAVGLVLMREPLIAGIVFLCATVAIYLREVWT